MHQYTCSQSAHGQHLRLDDWLQGVPGKFTSMITPLIATRGSIMALVSVALSQHPCCPPPSDKRLRVVLLPMLRQRPQVHLRISHKYIPVEYFRKGTNMKRIIAAPDSFKESLSAQEAARRIADGVHQVLPSAEVIQIPLSDGGEGLTDALVNAAGGTFQASEVTGPLGEKS